MAHCPVLAVTGQVPLSILGTNAHQEVDLDYLLRDCTVFHQTIYSPAQMPNLVQIAIQRALAESMPTAIPIPGDMGPQPVAGGGLAHKLFQSAKETVPAEADLAEAIKLVNAGGKVTVFAGIGVSNARDQVLELADKLKAPIGCSLRGKDILEADNPWYVGQVGLIGNPACGATGFRVEDPAELRATLKRALETDGPVLVDVVTNPDEISMPPRFTAGQAWGFSISKLKERLRSHGKDE